MTQTTQMAAPKKTLQACDECNGLRKKLFHYEGSTYVRGETCEKCFGTGQMFVQTQERKAR